MDKILEALEPTADPAWLLEESSYDPRHEAAAESRFSIGNGFLGVRGAREVSRGPTWVSWMPGFAWSSWPRTYVAGLFDTPNFSPPVPALVPAADWLRVRIRMNDRPLRLDAGNLLHHRRILDLRRGLLLIDWRQQTPAGDVVRVRTLRLVSQSERAIGLQLLLLELEQGEAEITLDATFDQSMTGLEAVRLEPELGVWRTEQTGQQLAMACRSALFVEDSVLQPEGRGPLAWTWRWTARAGEAAALQRMMAAVRGADPGPAATQALGWARALGASESREAHAQGWNGQLAAHVGQWAWRWQDCDIEVEGDAAAQQALRFAAYHLCSAVNPEDWHVSVGARGLTGDSYLGHVFWDTEIYLLPFYTVAWPEAAHALLMYRFNTLDGARAKAARLGFRGAMYAWESADSGVETTPDHLFDATGHAVDVLTGRQEQHITADVAYAVWQYWHITGDELFLQHAGAEILLETARFWASRAQLEADGRRHVRGVIGPDEYHEAIDDNVFTNRMARWNLAKAGEVAAFMRARWPAEWAALALRLSIDDAELALWRETEAALAETKVSNDGVLEQFAGYFALEDIDLSHYAGRVASMDDILGPARRRGSQLIKQADVVALLGLLPETFDTAAAVANFHYYEPRCTHDSSLSRPMHALVAARLGKTELALRYFRETAATDLAATTEQAAAGGVRMAALGGLWQVAVFGFAGLSFGEDDVSLAPKLPEAWAGMAFRARWRQRTLQIRIARAANTVTVTLSGEPMALQIGDTVTALQRDRTVEVAIPREAWKAG